MTWSKLAHSLLTDPKVVTLTDGAFRTYINGLVYAGLHMTDGYVSPDGLVVIRGTDVPQLVAKGLWEPLGDGWQIANYLDHQQSRADVERLKNANRARQTRARKNVTRD